MKSPDALKMQARRIAKQYPLGPAPAVRAVAYLKWIARQIPIGAHALNT